MGLREKWLYFSYPPAREPLGGVQYAPGHRIRIHVQDVGMGVDPAAWHGRHAPLYGELLRRLEPHASLLIDTDIAKPDTTGIPLVSIRLMD